MTKITANPNGTFTLAAGTYIVGGIGGDDGMYAVEHPDAEFEFYIPPVEEAGIHLDECEPSIQLLLLPFGADRFGVRDRTVQIGRYGFIGGEGLFISPVAESEYDLVDCFTSSSDTGALVTFDTDVAVVLDGTTVRIGDIVLDAARPGYYNTNGIVVDMSEPGLAEILGYNGDAEFDEHGLRLWIEEGDARIDALRALGSPTAIALAQQAEDDMIGCLYYSRAPQQEEVRLAA